jgi:DNA polymerase-3 subunit epsilon
VSLILFYDTETTGLPLFKEPSDDPRQPHIVQLAAQLVESDTRHTVASIDLTIRPDGWTIPEDVASIHGITTERAQAVGVSESLALMVFLGLWAHAAKRVGHSEAFDARMIRIAIKRYMPSPETADIWKGTPAECTMKLASAVLPTVPDKGKNLSDVHERLIGHRFTGAHSAAADTAACKAVYFALKDKTLQS